MTQPPSEYPVGGANILGMMIAPGDHTDSTLDMVIAQSDHTDSTVRHDDRPLVLPKINFDNIFYGNKYF